MPEEGVMEGRLSAWVVVRSCALLAGWLTDWLVG